MAPFLNNATTLDFAEADSCNFVLEDLAYKVSANRFPGKAIPRRITKKKMCKEYGFNPIFLCIIPSVVPFNLYSYNLPPKSVEVNKFLSGEMVSFLLELIGGFSIPDRKEAGRLFLNTSSKSSPIEGGSRIIFSFDAVGRPGLDMGVSQYP